MSLFMNMIEHPEMFMNTERIPTSNQHYYKYDSFAELMKSQEKVNHSLQKSFHLLEAMHNQQQNIQLNRWQEITDQMITFNKVNHERSKFESNVMKRLNQLDEQRKHVETILANEEKLKHEFTEQINQMIQTHEELLEVKLDQRGTSTEKLSAQIQQLNQLQQTTSEQINSQQEDQADMKERLENQEAIMEKVSRQLSYFRSILYERTNDLAEKIEESYELTSSYLYQLLTGTAEPLSTFMMKRKKKQLNTK